MQRGFQFDLDERMIKDLADLTDRLYGPTANMMPRAEWAKSILSHFTKLVHYWAFGDLDVIDYFEELVGELGSEHSRAAAGGPLGKLISANSRNYPHAMAGVRTIQDEWSKIHSEELGTIYCSLDLTAGLARTEMRARNDTRHYSYVLRHNGSVKSFSRV